MPCAALAEGVRAKRLAEGAPRLHEAGVDAEEEDGQADERVGEADGDAGELAARHLEQEELEGDEEGEERHDGGQGLREGLPEDVARREGLRRFGRGRAGGL